MAAVAKHAANACVDRATMQSRCVDRCVNPYVNPYVIACGLDGVGHWAGHGAGHGAAEAEAEPEMRVYEFVGDLAKYDLPDLLSEDGEVEEAGYTATELLTRALDEYWSLSAEARAEAERRPFGQGRYPRGWRSMSVDERAAVESLVLRIFDPSGTVLSSGEHGGRPFECTCIGATETVWPMLVFTRYASASHWTKLIVRFRDYFANDRSLALFCVTYERLPPQAWVRVT
jgi:hypothetical protein